MKLSEIRKALDTIESWGVGDVDVNFQVMDPVPNEDGSTNVWSTYQVKSVSFNGSEICMGDQFWPEPKNAGYEIR